MVGDILMAVNGVAEVVRALVAELPARAVTEALDGAITQKHARVRAAQLPAVQKTNKDEGGTFTWQQFLRWYPPAWAA